MKFLSLFYFTILVPAFAAASVQELKGLHGVDEDNADMAETEVQPKRTRQLKGSSKSKGDCKIELYYDNKDFRDSFESDSDTSILGANSLVTLYRKSNGNRAGQYSEVTVALGTKDALSYGSFTLAKKNNRPTSQIFTMATQYAKERAIIGGTGKYEGSDGYVHVGDKKNGKQYLTIYAC